MYSKSRGVGAETVLFWTGTCSMCRSSASLAPRTHGCCCCCPAYPAQMPQQISTVRYGTVPRLYRLITKAWIKSYICSTKYLENLRTALAHVHQAESAHAEAKWCCSRRSRSWSPDLEQNSSDGVSPQSAPVRTKRHEHALRKRMTKPQERHKQVGPLLPPQTPQAPQFLHPWVTQQRREGLVRGFLEP